MQETMIDWSELHGWLKKGTKKYETNETLSSEEEVFPLKKSIYFKFRIIVTRGTRDWRWYRREWGKTNQWRNWLWVKNSNFKNKLRSNMKLILISKLLRVEIQPIKIILK